MNRIQFDSAGRIIGVDNKLASFPMHKIQENYEDLDYLFRNTLCLISHFGNIQL